MFTGLVDDVGVIESAADSVAGREFRVRCRYDDLSVGESISVNGACLTVREHGPGWFSVAAVTTTVERTAMATWKGGTKVNLERAVRFGDRLGGHLVQGHVDGVGTVRLLERRGTALLIDVALGHDMGRLLVPQGSITIDGVSLTVNDIPSPDVVQVSIVEHTERHTTLGRLQPGDAVHIESDIIGKYVQRLLEGQEKQGLH